MQEAIASGILDPQRLASYQKLQKEVNFLERKQDERSQLAEKQRWKQITKNVRMHQKYKN